MVGRGEAARRNVGSASSFAIQKGDPNNLENYRPISLLNTFYKILAMILKNKIEEASEDRLMSTQFGLRKDKSTTQAMYVARREQEFAERAGLPGTMIFLDWERLLIR